LHGRVDEGGGRLGVAQHGGEEGEALEVEDLEGGKRGLEKGRGRFARRKGWREGR
jgi:hypothetical protein